MNIGFPIRRSATGFLTWESSTFCQKLTFLLCKSDRLLDHRSGLFRCIVKIRQKNPQTQLFHGTVYMIQSKNPKIPDSNRFVFVIDFTKDSVHYPPLYLYGIKLVDFITVIFPYSVCRPLCIYTCRLSDNGQPLSDKASISLSRPH